MSHKTRSNYTVGACFKKCKHKETEVCEDCIGFSEFEEEKDNDKENGKENKEVRKS